uniref:NACHT LRR and PYD domain-containing protein n=1 Tax=Sphenodon punctatus TaxID=8508 RepID=A0A8D0GGT3_SPHPU
MLTVRFLFGLLNEERMKGMREKFGWTISPHIKTDLWEWVKATKQKANYPNWHQLEAFHCLYETQDENLVKRALDDLTELTMERIKFTPMDQLALSFCVKNCPNLETISLYRCLFLFEDHEKEVLPAPLRKLHHKNVGQHEDALKPSPLYLLCQALKEPKSKLR